MKPRCYNRPEFKDSYRTFTGQEAPFRMSQKCGSWEAPEGSTPYPELVGWNCSGCRWNPNEVKNDE